MKHWMVSLLLFGASDAASTQPSSITLSDLSPLAGTWRSRIDPKYREHPMVRQFNPELKPQELVLESGPNDQFFRLSIWDLDRPQDGDRSLLVEGLVLTNSATNTMDLVEHNVTAGRVYLGTWSESPDGGFVRTFQTTLADGKTARYRETWRFTDETRTVFEWYTESYEDGAFVKGDVVVSWHKEKRSVARPPEWVSSNWERMIGTWIADNSTYANDDASMDAYGIEWGWGIGKSSLVGRLYGIKDGEEVATFWEFREFWHPEKREVVATQFGASGIYGEGPHTMNADGTTEMLQTFYNPALGTIARVGHRSRLDRDEHTTRSFDVSEGGTWTDRRTYVWRKTH